MILPPINNFQNFYLFSGLMVLYVLCAAVEGNDLNTALIVDTLNCMQNTNSKYLCKKLPNLCFCVVYSAHFPNIFFRVVLVRKV